MPNMLNTGFIQTPFLYSPAKHHIGWHAAALLQEAPIKLMGCCAAQQ
jgi:hypothetical protein